MPDVVSQAPDERPRWDVALALAAFAAGLRLAVLCVTLLLVHGPAGNGLRLSRLKLEAPPGGSG